MTPATANSAPGFKTVDIGPVHPVVFERRELHITMTTQIITNEDIENTMSTVENTESTTTTTPAPTSGFGTPAGQLDPKAADAHRAKIAGVGTKTFDSGTTAVQIQFESIDTGAGGRDFTLSLFPPVEFFAAEYWNEQGFNAEALSRESPGLNDSGRPKQSPAQSYARNISNSKGTGEIQNLIAIAEKQGRTPAALGLSTPTNSDEYIAVLNAVLVDTEVVIVRRPETNADPRFDGELKIKRVLEPESATNPKTQGFFKEVRKMWA